MRFRGIKIKGNCLRLGEIRKKERKSERLKDMDEVSVMWVRVDW